MQKWKKAVLLSALVLSLIPAGLLNAANSSDTNSYPKKTKSNNLIILIGNGLGFEQMAAARANSWHFSRKSQLELDSYQAGTVRMNDKNVDFVASVIQAAQLEGKRTGYVSTSDITNGIIAEYAAPRQKDGLQMTWQWLDSGVNVIFGGGKSKFLGKQDGRERPGASILNDYRKKGYRIVKDAEELRTLNTKNCNVLGLFADSDLPFVSDRDPSIPGLSEMTRKAINLLADPTKGFVLVVEAGRIADADHAHDLPSEIQETLEFDEAVKTAVDFANHDQHTSVVVTSNGDAGELPFAEHGDNQWNMDLMDDQVHSSEYIVYHSSSRLANAKTVAEMQAIVNLNSGLNISDQEAEFIIKNSGSAFEQERAYNSVVSNYLNVKWNDSANSKADVGVWAYGPIADSLKGRISHAEIAEACADVIGLDQVIR